MRLGAARFVLLLALVARAAGFYLPGVAPQDYARDDVVNFKVNSLSSAKSALPLEYYALPFCRPEKIIPSAENLGEARVPSDRGGREGTHTPSQPQGSRGTAPRSRP